MASDLLLLGYPARGGHLNQWSIGLRASDHAKAPLPRRDADADGPDGEKDIGRVIPVTAKRIESS
jgi:hypothetical protein